MSLGDAFVLLGNKGLGPMQTFGVFLTADN